LPPKAEFTSVNECHHQKTYPGHVQLGHQKTILIAIPTIPLKLQFYLKSQTLAIPYLLQRRKYIFNKKGRRRSQ
jgi:hypothetical protein